MRTNKKIAVMTTALIAVALIVVISIKSRSNVVSTKVSATVTEVVDRPNVTENGYYVIDAQDKNGQKYTINATGYLNTPITPDSQGDACITVPKVKSGDKIEFNLPLLKDNKTFDICYKKNLKGYYFNLK